MLKKLKLKLTALNAAVVFAILICIVSFVYVSVQLDSFSNADNELMNDAYMLKRYVPLFESGQNQNTELMEEYENYKERLNAANISYGIWDAQGNHLAYVSSYNVPLNALSAIRELVFCKDKKALIVSSQADGNYYVHSYDYNALNLRVCTTVFSGDSGKMRIIQTVQNMNSIETMADRLRVFLLFSVLIGVLLSVITGYFIAGNSIKPVQESMKQQKEFIADASHELRTPITIMRTNLDVVKCSEDESVGSQMEWIENAYRETEHMQELVNDLLQLAKNDAGTEEINRQQIFARRLCMEVVERFRPIAEKKDIKLKFTCSAPSAILSADHQKLTQLLSIVADNAIKYSGNGQQVEFCLKRAGKNVVFEVTDNGIGIDESELENIFNRFYRTDKARSRKEGGTGLGLAIAKQIAEAHGGTITAQSQKGHGTTITISLPEA